MTDWKDEREDLLFRFHQELAKATSDGSRKRQAGTKPPWYADYSHESAVFSHLTKWKRGELEDEDSGAHPLVHAAWRLLAIACRESGNVPKTDTNPECDHARCGEQPPASSLDEDVARPTYDPAWGIYRERLEPTGSQEADSSAQPDFPAVIHGYIPVSRGLWEDEHRPTWPAYGATTTYGGTVYHYAVTDGSEYRYRRTDKMAPEEHLDPMDDDESYTAYEAETDGR